MAAKHTKAHRRRLSYEGDHNDPIISGVIKVHHRGFGFVRPDDPTEYQQDIFIPRHLTGDAVDGDTVEVQVNSIIPAKGPEGRVLSVTKRGRTHTAGTVISAKEGECWAYAPLLGAQQLIYLNNADAYNVKYGDRIIIHMTYWGSKGDEPEGDISQIMGHINDPATDVKAAIQEYEIRSEFSPAVLKQAKGVGNRVKTADMEDREDFRDWEVVTVDPTTAKDFDDAISLTKDKKGTYHLGVHIADVSHYVPAGSPIDQEAELRCNSTYFPGECVPMLPPELSENLCSLRPKVNRLTVSVLMSIDKKGKLLNYKIVRGVIRSQKRFTYSEAKKVLDGEKSSEHSPLLKRMVELCKVLKKNRFERGSLELAMPEVRVVLDDKGEPQGLDYIEYDITHQMIEEFMLKANEVVAKHLTDLGEELPYRTHEEPSDENMQGFVTMAKAFGHGLPNKPSPQELQALFDEVSERPYGQYLATTYIRSLKQALYSPVNQGHYGLSLEHYCHFTSPIRRYADLIVHRNLFGEEHGGDALQRSTERCSEQERVSAKAEMAVNLLKKFRLLLAEHERDCVRDYTAIVTRVRGVGLSFELPDYMLEGFLHISELDNDYFVFDEGKQCLRGTYNDISYRSGDEITVMVKHLDLITLESQWYLIPDEAEPLPVKTPKMSKKDGKRRSGKGKKRGRKR